MFDKTGNRLGTEVTCQPWESKQIHEAWDLINSYPEWTDEQDLEAARKLGMRFGPDKKADLLRIFPLQGLSSIYGPLQITEASFRITGLKEPESSFADRGRVSDQASRPDSTERVVERFHLNFIMHFARLAFGEGGPTFCS